MSQDSIDIIDQWNLDLVSRILAGSPLKVGQFWNVEILENYIQKANIQCSIFYYKEIPDEEKFVLIRSRPNMSCPPRNSQCLVFVELSNKHKMLVQELPGKVDCHVHFQNTDFTLPI